MSIAERRVFRWLNEPTGQRLFAAVRSVLLAYGTTRLPSGKWLLIMKVECSTCNYSTPVVCVYMFIRLVGSIWNTFSRHSRANLALKAFPARVYGLKFGPSKIISYSRILLISALSTFAELRARLKDGWWGRWGCRPYPTLSFAVFNCILPSIIIPVPDS